MCVEAGRGADGPVLKRLREVLFRETGETLPSRYRRKPEVLAMYLMIAAVAEETDRQLALLSERVSGVPETASDTTPTCGSIGDGCEGGAHKSHTITPAMVEAGERALDESRKYWSTSIAVEAIYRAMWAARKKADD